MKRPKRVAVFPLTHCFNNSSVCVLACMYCSFSFHYSFWENLFFMFFPTNLAIWIPTNLAKQWNQNRFGSIPFRRTWLFMFLKPSKPIKTEDQNSETKTKTEATNLRLNRSNPYEKIKTDQPIKTIWNQNQTKPMKSIWNQNQIKPIKRIYPLNSLLINLSNPLPINPSTTTKFPNQTHQTHCQSTHQTHRQSTHSPPPSSQIKKLKH